MSNEIEVRENILAKNERLAAEVNGSLSKKGVFAINVMGAPGAGKTTALLNIIPNLGLPSFVIEGDIQSDIDTRTMAAAKIPAAQINTGGACHLDAPMIAKALPARLPDFLFIENIGNLVCPAEFMIGEHVKILVVTVADGDDKPYKYPLAFEKADAILLNKMDLMPYMNFSVENFTKGVRLLNVNVPIFSVSGKDAASFDEVVRWILKKSGKRSL